MRIKQKSPSGRAFCPAAATAMLLCVCLLLSACSAALDPAFDKGKISAAASDIADLLGQRRYDEVESYVREDLRSYLNAAQISEDNGELLSQLGSLRKIKRTEIYSRKMSENGELYAVAILVCEHRNGPATYTFYFDTDMRLVGLAIQ